LADIDAAEIREAHRDQQGRSCHCRLACHAAPTTRRSVGFARTGRASISYTRNHQESLCRGREVEIRALIPYERGDLVNSIHQTGEF
jgi:hypothetical protein